MKRLMWPNLVLGLWLMVSPFVLLILNRRIFRILWGDSILGFGILTFSLCRLLSRRSDQIIFADWFVTALGVMTLINPFLYGYYNVKAAVWNNLAVGAVVSLLAIFQDWIDSDGPMRHDRHRSAH